MLVGRRRFGGLLLYFISAGEFYTIGTLIAFPGGVYAEGLSYAIWFMGYIVLAWPFAYYLTPLWNRMGKRYNAMTMPDVFGRRFKSRGLEIIVFMVSFFVFLFAAQYQFTGLQYAVRASGFDIPPLVTLLAACGLALLCVVFAGIRQQATLAPLKDILMLLAILAVAVGAIAVATGGVGEIFDEASATVRPGFFAERIPGSAAIFTATTIIAQMVPAGIVSASTGATHALSAKSEAALKRQYVWFPIYMLMYPFLIIAIYSAVGNITVDDPNAIFVATAVELLPPALVGFVGASACIAALLVLAFNALNLGGIISRNLVPGLPEQRQKFWTRGGIVLFFVLSICLTLFTSPDLMVTILNLEYYVMVQLVPGALAMFFLKGVRAEGLGAGLVVGSLLSLILYYGDIHTYDINIGLITMAINFITIMGVSYARRQRGAPSPVFLWRRTGSSARSTSWEETADAASQS